MLVAMRYGIARGVHEAGLRLGRRRVRHCAERAAAAAGAQCHHGGLHRLRTLDNQRDDDSPDGCLAERDDVECRGRGSRSTAPCRASAGTSSRFVSSCSAARRSSAGRTGEQFFEYILGTKVTTYRSIFLSADSFWRDGPGQSGVGGLGQSDERAPGVSESDWRCAGGWSRKWQQTPAGAPSTPSQP